MTHASTKQTTTTKKLTVPGAIVECKAVTTPCSMDHDRVHVAAHLFLIVDKTPFLTFIRRVHL